MNQEKHPYICRRCQSHHGRSNDAFCSDECAKLYYAFLNEKENAKYKSDFTEYLKSLPKERIYIGKKLFTNKMILKGLNENKTFALEFFKDYIEMKKQYQS